MKRHFVLVWAILLTGLLLARGEGPDDRYVQIYNLIQEADGLNDAGQARAASLKYLEAQKALKTLQTDYPTWNGNVISFRLAYIASKLEPLAQKLPAPVPATNAPPAVQVAETPLPSPPAPNQARELQEEIKRLTAQNALLEAKLKEALSVQPAPSDPRELAKAEEQIKSLQRERELLRVCLDQEKAKSVQPGDGSVLGQEQQILADVKQKLAQQTELAMNLQKENETLKRQLASTPPNQEAMRSDLAQQLESAKGTITVLQSSNLGLRTDQILLESRLAELSKQISKRGNRGNPRPEDRRQELETALARLAVYEAKPVPYAAEELAMFKQPDLKVDISAAAPMRRTVKELPPGAGPIMEEGKRAAESGRFEVAEKKFLDVLHQDEKNTYVLGNLAVVQIEQNRLADAEKTIAQALAIDPRDPASLFTMGLLKFHQEKYDAALDSLSLSASLIPDEPRTQYFLGKTLIQKGNRAAAEVALRKAVQLRPGWGDAHFSLAMVYATQQPPFKELAQWHYQKALVGGYPRSLEFEKLLEEKKASSATP